MVYFESLAVLGSYIKVAGRWDNMETERCSKCDTIYPRPALTKDLVCVMCEPPITGDRK
tara:strand:- start:289 stop:465 length:177 start_codon:yes stop_codon:yes gene_type:complete